MTADDVGSEYTPVIDRRRSRCQQ